MVKIKLRALSFFFVTKLGERCFKKFNKIHELKANCWCEADGTERRDDFDGVDDFPERARVKTTGTRSGSCPERYMRLSFIGLDVLQLC